MITSKRNKRTSADSVEPIGGLRPKALLIGGALVSIFVFCVYAWTGSQTLISCGDSAELTAAAASFGVAHAPGYPLFTVGGGIFSAFTPGAPALGVNLFNAFCGALAVGSMFFLLVLLTGQWLPSIAGALTLGFSFHFWLYSHVPEISALNAFFIGLLLWLTLPLIQKNARALSTQRLYAIALVVGLGISHHHSIVFLLPGICFCLYVWWKEQTAKPGARQWAAMGVCAGVGMIPYLYVPLRAHTMPYMNAGTVTSLARFIDHFTRRAYGVTALTPEYPPFNEVALESALGFFGHSLVTSFSWPGVALGIFGFLILLWKSPKIFLVLATTGMLAGPFFVAWSGMPANTVVLRTILERFFVAPFFLFSVGIGVALSRITEKFKESGFGRSFPGGAKAMSLGVIFLLPASLLVQHFRPLNFSDFTLCEMYGRDLQASLSRNAVVFVHGDNSLFTLWYLQRLTAARPDLKILNSSMSAPYSDHLRVHFPELRIPPETTPTLQELIAKIQGQRPLYIIGIPGSDFKELGLMGNPFHLRPSGLAFEIVAQPESEEASLLRSVPLEFQVNLAEKWRGTYFVEEIVYLYTIGHYNRAVIHAAHGHFRAAYEAAQQTLAVDPRFYLARDLSERMARKINGTSSPTLGIRSQ